MAFLEVYLNARTDGGAADVVSLSLHDADPGTTGANELSGGSYTRETPTWPAASGGDSQDTVTFDVPSGTDLSTPYVGAWDGSSTPVFQGGFAGTDQGTWPDGGTLDVTATLSSNAA